MDWLAVSVVFLIDGPALTYPFNHDSIPAIEKNFLFRALFILEGVSSTASIDALFSGHTGKSMLHHM